MLCTASEKDRKRYIYISIMSATIVAVWAVFQYFGSWIVSSRYPWRTISTLGNPNYLAGYLLMILPLFQRVRSPEWWIIAWVLVFAILTTGSYIGIGLLGCYLLYQCIRVVLGIAPSKAWLMTLIVLGVTIVWGYGFIASDKLLSLTSRFVLMRESISMMFNEPLSLLVGFGPDSLIHHFGWVRSDIVSAYFPSWEIIDSSHNMLIDIWFQYGILPIMTIGYWLYRIWRTQKEDIQIAVLLGIWFLLLNVFVVVHLVLLAILMIAREKVSSS